MSKKKPKASDGRTVTFQIDDDTKEAIEKLEAAAPPGLPRPRSYVIRRALIDSVARIGSKGGR
jgi:predicted transcriptional regulator